MKYSEAALQGVIAAAITPMNHKHELELKLVPDYLAYLSARGCHGALLLGTTGEGTSFSYAQRKLIFEAGIQFRKTNSQFFLLAGTGTPNLAETIALTSFAFDLGYDAVVVLPPYYYKRISQNELYQWYTAILGEAVPDNKYLLAYHIPQITGIQFTFELFLRLQDKFPDKFGGVKDSSPEQTFVLEPAHHFGSQFRIFTGNDKFFTAALNNNASGCITALANIASPLSRVIWDANINGETRPEIQEALSSIRIFLDKFPPAPKVLKAVLPEFGNFPKWSVALPLLDFEQITQAQIQIELDSLIESLPIIDSLLHL